MKNRFTVKIGGESGQGVNSVGEMLAKALKCSGLFVFGYREYPSLIQGGFASYQIEFSDEEINSASAKCNLAISLSRRGVYKMLKDLRSNGILVHSMKKLEFGEEEQKIIDENNLQVVEVDAKGEVERLGGIKIMQNTFLIGLAWRMLNFAYEDIETAFIKEFGRKKGIIESNLKILEHAYKFGTNISSDHFKLNFKKKESWENSMVVAGNEALALGSFAAGVRAYYAYPMTPSSSILTYLAGIYKETGMIVKQAEDEMTAALMTIGSMHMGARALVATSGGGFDLMTESLSFAAMVETPFVCIIAQRPGPSTGVPTWTAAGDLLLAAFSGHGEFPRVVLAASDAESCYRVIQHAFNLAEKFQIQVLVLTEKQIAESLYNLADFPENLPIERGLISDVPTTAKRYAITETGISPRWLPGQSDVTYNANSDEHFDNGRLTEDGEEIKAMFEKRMKKTEYINKELPEPQLFGNNKGDVLFVGWGSVKAPVLDAISGHNNISYLHYETVYPVKTSQLEILRQSFGKLVLIENNYLGQLGIIIGQTSDVNFDDKLLKYDGRPFFIEEIENYINNGRQ